MRSDPDFADALASLDWADRQIDVLNAEITSFTAANPYAITPEKQADGWTIFYMAKPKPVAKSLIASINAILQAQRSSLDYMAVALAEANGATDPSNTYFPITQTKDGFSDPRTLKKLRLLDPADKQRILDLKPYGGGNDTLFALHTLNNERKHRRLGVISGAAVCEKFMAPGPGSTLVSHFAYYRHFVLPDGRSPVAAIRHVGDVQLQFGLHVAFKDVPGANPKPLVIPTLDQFGALCREIAVTLRG